MYATVADELIEMCLCRVGVFCIQKKDDDVSRRLTGMVRPIRMPEYVSWYASIRDRLAKIKWIWSADARRVRNSEWC
jgi:hypothetical protein